jgi:hypothetical protein
MKKTSLTKPKVLYSMEYLGRKVYRWCTLPQRFRMLSEAMWKEWGIKPMNENSPGYVILKVK